MTLERKTIDESCAADAMGESWTFRTEGYEATNLRFNEEDGSG